MIYTPTLVSLSPDSSIKRYPPRKPEDRQSNYLEKFDFLTVFADVFVRDERLWMIGPKWENLELELMASTFKWNGTDISASIKFESLNRMSRASAEVPNGSGVLKIDGPLGSWTINVSEVPSDLNLDRNILVTQQQDNRLEWIAYWAFYNVVVNNIDSIVIYDNASELYSTELIDQVLSMIPGLKSHVVVRWDIPFGPLCGPNSMWDSDYGQHVAWEHSRRYFSPSAASALLIDIDELPIHAEGKSLPEALANSGNAALHFRRQPICRFPNRANTYDGVRIHSDYSLGDERGAWQNFKYIYDPSQLSETSQLMIHSVKGQFTPPPAEEEIFAGHFNAIRLHWRLGGKVPAKNLVSTADITEPTVRSSVFDNKFDELAHQWRPILQKLIPLINSQSEPHLL